MRTALFCFALHGLALLSTSIHPTTAGIAELLNGVDDTAMVPPHSIVTNSLREAMEDNNVGTPCHVEYQVTKRAAGRCVKLGRDIRACASGTYLDPFHPECM